MKRNPHPHSHQEANEANTFIYSFLQQNIPELAEEFRNTNFTQHQSQENLDKSLSMLPHSFLNSLISSKRPQTDFPSLIYNTRPFSLLDQKLFRPKNSRRLELEYNHIQNIKVTHRIVGHTRIITLIYHDPAQQFFITVSQDRTMKLWHRSSLTLIHTFKGHEKSVISADISPDRTLLASLSSDLSVRIWSLINGACIHRFLNQESSQPTSLNFSSCGHYLAISYDNGQIIFLTIQEIDHNNISFKHQYFPIWKTALLHYPVSSCAFSPGGRLVAAALDTGLLAVFTVIGEKLWTVRVSDTRCDFCFFNPLVPSQIFACCSKNGVAILYEITNRLNLIRTFDTKPILKRKQSFLFALSCDSSILYASSSTQLIAWSVLDAERPIAKIANLPTAIEMSPHPHIPTVVALVCQKVVLILDTSNECCINKMDFPDFPFRLDSGNWCENGLDFYVSDTIGGIYVFRQCKDTHSNNDNSLTNEQQHSLDQAEHKCLSSYYFFPSDFTESYYDENRGEVEENTNLLTILSPKTLICDDHGHVLIDNYRPHNFSELYMPYVQHSSISILQEYENKWIPALSTKQILDVQSDVMATENEKVDALAVIDSKDPSTLLMSSSSNDDDDDENDPFRPTTHYPAWTSLDSPEHNSYFPQVNDRVVYIRKGHLQMLADDNKLLKNSITPNIDDETMWPEIAAFVVTEVAHGRYTCMVSLKRLNSTLNGGIEFLDNINHVNSLQIVEDEPIRVLEYPICYATAFLILAEQFGAAVDAFENKMKDGDVVDIFFLRSDGTEKKYSGTLLEKLGLDNPAATVPFTWYNSLSIDWGTDSEQDFGLYSPWEVYAINEYQVYKTSGASNDSKLLDCSDSVQTVLTMAQKKVRSLRPFFKQPFFSKQIIYPCDFGLIKRRLSNNFYRTMATLDFDIANVMSTQLVIQMKGSIELILLKLLVDRVRNVIERPDLVDTLSDFSSFDEEAEDIKDQEDRKNEIKQREMRNRKRKIGHIYDIDNSSDEFGFDSIPNLPDLYGKRNRKARNFAYDYDDYDINYEEVVRKPLPNRNRSTSKKQINKVNKTRKKRKKQINDDDYDYYEYYEEDANDDQEFVDHDLDGEEEDISTVISEIRRTPKAVNDNYTYKKRSQENYSNEYDYELDESSLEKDEDNDEDYV